MGKKVKLEYTVCFGYWQE